MSKIISIDHFQNKGSYGLVNVTLDDGTEAVVAVGGEVEVYFHKGTVRAFVKKGVVGESPPPTPGNLTQLDELLAKLVLNDSTKGDFKAFRAAIKSLMLEEQQQLLDEIMAELVKMKQDRDNLKKGLSG